jgi:uncharacterized UBP type Zn finger protein
MAVECTHIDQIRVTRPTGHTCQACVAIGAAWVHLRMCLVCGNVACCDSSQNRHASAHFRATRHPLMRSIEPGEAWTWCFIDEVEPGELDE